MQDTIKKPTARQQKQPSATQLAADKIRQLIFTGELVADSNHLETELAERLGMSRTPVREATLTLQAHGLLEIQPRKGIRIKAITVQDVVDLYEVLTEMECLAAKRAANAGYNKSDLKPLLDAVNVMEQSLNDEDLESWAQADELFHLELVRFSGNQYIEGLVKNINDQVRRVRSITLNMRPLPTKSNKDHRKLYQAIVKGDADKAQHIHRQHRKDTAALLTSILNKSGLNRV